MSPEPRPLRVCTVLPTYNEAENITLLVQRLLAAVRPPYLVLVVDDDSPDGTGDVVATLVERYQQPEGVRLIRRGSERGLTSALQRGIDEAISQWDAEIVTWMDCDLSMPPEDVPRLVEAIEAGADVAVASRWIGEGKDVAHGVMARALSWIINHFAVLMLGRASSDYTSGFVAARRAVLEEIRLRGDYGEYCIDLLARAYRVGFQLVEVPYICVPRFTGESKTGIHLGHYLAKGRHYVTTILRLHAER